MNARLLLESIGGIVDLAQPVSVEMPNWPNNPPFVFGLVRPHGSRRQAGVSSAVEVMVCSGHTGSHMDALGHFSKDGLLHGGHSAEASQSYDRGLQRGGIEQAPLQPRRGVLLDVARACGEDPLGVEREITPAHLEAAQTRACVEVSPGDAVLLRTGWGRFWNDRARFPLLAQPGPSREAADWLSSRRVAMVGSDTMTFERFPNTGWPVHVHFLIDQGIHILENLNLEELAERAPGEFVFMAAPLRLVGATGSMIRPLAFVGPLAESDSAPTEDGG